MVNPARSVRRALPTARSTRVGGSSCAGQPGRLAAPAHQEVDLHVHQPGQQYLVAEIDELAFRLAPHTDDPVTLDPHDAGPKDLAAVNVEEPGGLEGQLR